MAGMKGNAFYTVAGDGAMSEVANDPRYWHLRLNLTEKLENDLMAGVRLKYQQFPRIAAASRATGFQDFPATHAPTLIASDAAKTFLEMHASNDVQFIPLKIVTRSRRVLLVKYWIVNILKRIDCVDKKKSPSNKICDELVYHWICINGSKVPRDTMLFRCDADPHNAYVRGDLAMRLRESGLTGAYFFPTGRPGDSVM